MSHAAKARLLRDEYEAITGVRPPYPRSRVALQGLRDRYNAAKANLEATLHDVVQNILDEPIPDSVKARLLKPLQPGKYRPSPAPRKAKERKRKALEEEFDPIPRQKSSRSGTFVPPKERKYLEDILDFSFDKKEEVKTDELVFKQTQWALKNSLRSWQMDVPKGHPQGADPRAFLEDAELLIQEKLEEELKTLKGGLKFQLALKVDLEKANPDGSEEYTDPV